MPEIIIVKKLEKKDVLIEIEVPLKESKNMKNIERKEK